MNRKAKSIVRRYRIEKILILFSMALIIWCIHFLFYNDYIYIIFLFIYLVFGIRLSAFLETENFSSIIINDLDAELFSEVVNCLDKNRKIDIMWDIDSSYYLGNYHKVVNTCFEKLKIDNGLSVQIRCFYMLANVYFQLGEKDNLKSIYDKFLLITVKQNTFKQKILNVFSICSLDVYRNKNLKLIFYRMKIFESYLKGDFEECLTMLNKNKTKTNYQKINKDFYRAIIYYRSGDMTQSKILFEEIIQKAPKMNFAKISQKYLEAIENSAGIDVSFSDMLQPQSDEL